MTTDPSPVSRGLLGGLEHLLEQVLFASRWLVVPAYAGLVLVLGLLVIRFCLELGHALPGFMEMTATETIILALQLVDLTLVMNLVAVILLAGFDNFVSRMALDEHPDRPEWLGRLTFAGMKQKVVGSIIGITAVYMLESFLNIEHQSQESLILRIALFLCFVLAGLILAWTERLSGHD
jgi:uncharacterized protein (TIGR00645 family)